MARKLFHILITDLTHRKGNNIKLLEVSLNSISNSSKSSTKCVSILILSANCVLNCNLHHGYTHFPRTALALYINMHNNEGTTEICSAMLPCKNIDNAAPHYENWNGTASWNIASAFRLICISAISMRWIGECVGKVQLFYTIRFLRCIVHMRNMWLKEMCY